MSKTRLIALVISMFSASASATDPNLEKTIQSFFPKALSSMTSDSGEQLTLANDGLRYVYKEAKLIRNRNEQDIVVLYQAWIALSQSSCMLSVIQIQNGKASIASPTVLKKPHEISNCDDIKLIDFDGSGIPEVVVTTTDIQGRGSLPKIYGWQTDKLVNINPAGDPSGSFVSALRDFKLTTMKSGNSQIIIDTPNEIFADDLVTRTFAMVNGKFSLQGTYDFFQIIDITSMKAGSVTYDPSFAAAGSYTLEVKNVSDHNRPVRAEVTVNGSVVLKPQDFCSAPAHPKSDKGWWGGHDDDDDNDFDHCKRCVPKNDVYAIVNMKTANEIKVKVYGMKDSKIQLTLVKK